MTALIVAFSWGIANTEWQLTPLVCGAAALLLLVELIRYVESVNRELSSFLNFVTHHDFAVSFPIAEKGEVFRQLEAAYGALASEYRSLNAEKAANHQYLESLIEHVSTALVCLDGDGTVQLMNRQARELLKTPHLHSARSFKRVDENLPSLLDGLDDGDRSLVELEIEGETLQLVLFATEFQLLGHRYKLISFQNIRDELEQREVDFSQKLIRVMTHEIMNSVTPIIALSRVIEEAISRLGESGSDEELSEEERSDLVRSVASIQSRSSGLLRFVQAYSTLTNLPRPNFSDVDVRALLEQVDALMTPAAAAAGVALEIRLGESEISVRADSEQIQQVLINLVKNSIEALNGRRGHVTLFAGMDTQGEVVIQVTDDGPGIDQDQLENVFVPFFTTKRRGTGVGLSVSRQIMSLNKGLISVRSVPGRGTEFTLRFR